MWFLTRASVSLILVWMTGGVVDCTRARYSVPITSRFRPNMSLVRIQDTSFRNVLE
jgi:hypothetical protein